MSVQVKTPTKSSFERVDIQSFSSPESIRRSKDDNFIKVDKFSQPWGRKRRYSQTYRREEGAARRKRLKSSPCAGPLPNRFLNGGSIDDPLNLNGLDSSELGRQLNSVTPKSSPLPTPSRRESVEVRIPFNVTDPLNLNDSNEEADLEKLLKKKRQRNRHKKKDDSQLFSPAKTLGMDKNLIEALKIDIEPEQSVSDSSKQKEVQKPKPVSNKIVSPVIPQISPKNKKRRRTASGSKTEPSQTASRSLQSFPSHHSGKQDKRSPKKFKHPKPLHRRSNSSNEQGGRKCQKFIYGNYSRYYGYRNPSLEEDKRLKCFRKEWFEGKSILDIGCNVGHMTLSLACHFMPSKIVGIDIDPKLIMVARKNIRYYMSSDLVASSKFPISNMLSYGPIEAPPVLKEGSRQLVFPQNVLFKQGNYVLESDELLELQKEEYDVVLALSVTKWVHFNWADDGLKRFFKRVYRQLRPGGRFILEPQPWSSYKKKKKLTSEIHANFKKIQLRPEQFTDYLLSREVGFSTCYTLDVPFNASKGFRRPIMVFKKSDTIQNSPSSDVGITSPAQIHSVPGATPSSASIYSEDTSSSSSSDSEWSVSSETSAPTPRQVSAPETLASACTSECCVDDDAKNKIDVAESGVQCVDGSNGKVQRISLTGEKWPSDAVTDSKLDSVEVVGEKEQNSRASDITDVDLKELVSDGNTKTSGCEDSKTVGSELCKNGQSVLRNGERTAGEGSVHSEQVEEATEVRAELQSEIASNEDSRDEGSLPFEITEGAENGDSSEEEEFNNETTNDNEASYIKN